MDTTSTHQFLRVLRRLDRDWQTARDRLSDVRALSANLSANLSIDLAPLEEAEAAARAAYDAHAALEPELSREYADRAELADLTADARRKEAALTRLLDAPLATAPAGAVELAETAVREAEAARAALVAEASALDATYQAASAAGASWSELGGLEARASRLRDALGRAETRCSRAEARHRDALDRERAARTAARQRTADIELAREELQRVRAAAEAVRARLPAIAAAPLREPRRGYALPVPPELHDAIRERYRWEPATGTLHRLPRGEPVRAAQTVMVNGHRLSRAAVLAVLAPPAPDHDARDTHDLDALTPEDLA